MFCFALPLLQSQTNANVEVYQQYPDGVPRKVFISGPPECVDLAAVMVEEVIFATHLPEGITLYFFPGIRLLSLSGGLRLYEVFVFVPVIFPLSPLFKVQIIPENLRLRPKLI